MFKGGSFRVQLHEEETEGLSLGATEKQEPLKDKIKQLIIYRSPTLGGSTMYLLYYSSALFMFC